MKIRKKILLAAVVAAGGMGSFTTAFAHGHGRWHGGYYVHGGYYYRHPRVVIYPPPVYQYAPYAYPGYYPYYSYAYPYYGSSFVIVRGGRHHHHHHR